MIYLEFSSFVVVVDDIVVVVVGSMMMMRRLTVAILVLHVMRARPYLQQCILPLDTKLELLWDGRIRRSAERTG